MAGLGVGALSLSMSTSQVKHQIQRKINTYIIDLAANKTLYGMYIKDVLDNEGGIILYNGSRGDNQQFVFFPLDGGTYAIVNKNSGKPGGFDGDASFGNGVRDASQIKQALRQNIGLVPLMNNGIYATREIIIMKL